MSDAFLVETDDDVDCIYVYARGSEPPPGKTRDTQEVAPGVLIDYCDEDKIVGIEILGVRDRIRDAATTSSSSREEDEKDKKDIGSYVRANVSWRVFGDARTGTSCAVVYLHASRGDEVEDLRRTDDARLFLGTCARGSLRCLLIRAPEHSLSRWEDVVS